MRVDNLRTGKYKAKVRGFVLPNQAKSYKAASVVQAALDQLPGSLTPCSLQSTILRPYYVDFARRINQIKRQHSGAIAVSEACTQYEKWISRGLNSACLEAILNHFNLTCAAAPVVLCPNTTTTSCLPPGTPTDYSLSAAGYQVLANNWFLTESNICSLSFTLSTSAPASGQIYVCVYDAGTGTLLFEAPLVNAAALTPIPTLYTATFAHQSFPADVLLGVKFAGTGTVIVAGAADCEETSLLGWSDPGGWGVVAGAAEITMEFTYE